MAKVAARRQAAKKSSDGSTPTDETNKGTVTIPKQPEAENPLQTGAPPAGQSNAANPPLTDSQVMAQTQPSQSGSGHVPSTQSGNSLENAGTSALDKSAAFLSGVGALVAAKRQELAGAPKEAAAATPAPAAPAAAPASTDDAALKQANELFRQIGALVTGDEEGRELVNRLIVKQAGITQAQQMMTDAAIASDTYARYAAAEYEAQQKAAAEQHYYDQQMAALPPAKQAAVIKMSGLLHKESVNFTHPDDHFWFCKGAAAGQDMAAMMDGGGDAGAPPPGGDAGGDMQVPGGDGTPTPEDVQEMLEALVQSGQITPEQANELMNQLAQEMGGGGAAGAPPEDAPPSEEQKQASAALAALGADTLINVPAAA